MSFYQDYLKKGAKEKTDSSTKKESKYSPQKGSDRSEPRAASPRSREELERDRFLKRVSGEKKNSSEEPENNLKKPSLPEEREDFLPPIPPAPPKKQKVWVRILVVFLIISAISSLSALLWWWLIKTPRIVTEVIEKEVETIVEIPEIAAPLSFLKYDGFLDPIVTRRDEIPTYLRQYMKDGYPENQLLKISIKDHTDRTNPRFIGPETLFSSLKITVPSGFYDKVVRENLNLFLYSGKQNDLGVAFQIEAGGMTEFLGMFLSLEDSAIERHFKNFYILAEKKEAFVPPSTSHRRVTIRCRNFEGGHQLCFTPHDEIFLMTTSLESAKAAIDNFR